MVSRRRQEAMADMGFNKEQEERKRDETLKKEEERRRLKEEKRQEMMSMTSYVVMDKTAKIMDKYLVDPILGFFFPAAGDMLSSVLAVPFIYYSLCVVKSIPLTLAVISNVLVDMLVGIVPLLGDVIDVFHRSYSKNLRLITGYIDDDKQIIRQVNKKAVKAAIFIVVLCLLIYWLTSLVAGAIAWMWHGITSLFG